MSEDEKPYEIGYAKPPKKSQFKPGESGNPKGRKKGVKNFNSYLKDAGSERVTVTMSGVKRSVPLVQASAIQVAQKAAKGDLKALAFIANAFPDDPAQSDPLGTRQWESAADKSVLEAMLERMRGQPTTASSDPTPSPESPPSPESSKE